MTPERLRQLAERHIEREAAGDMTAVMETLSPEPAFDYVTAGRRLAGLAEVTAFYEHFFSVFQPRVRGGELYHVWFDDSSAASHHRVDVEVDGIIRPFEAIGIFVPDHEHDLLAGEKVFAEPEFIRLMMGDELFEKSAL
jgi:hypothetical protein